MKNTLNITAGDLLSFTSDADLSASDVKYRNRQGAQSRGECYNKIGNLTVSY